MKQQLGEKSEIVSSVKPRMIDDVLKDRKIYTLDREAPTKQFQDLHTSLFADHVAVARRHQAQEFYGATEESATPSRQLSTTRGDDGFQLLPELRHHLLEKLSFTMNQPMRTFDFTVSTGSRIIGPPYDTEWGIGSAWYFLSRHDGKLSTWGTTDGYSAAGVGFYVSSPEPLTVAITPMGSYDWNWVAFGDIPSYRSRGGLGITLYLNDDPRPSYSRQVTLWNKVGAKTWMADSRAGRIADAASPVLENTFGPVPLAPVFANIGPGQRYLVWVWCWQIEEPVDSPILSVLQMNMPFVTLNAGPQIVIR